jgi:hypothetical protein
MADSIANILLVATYIVLTVALVMLVVAVVQMHRRSRRTPGALIVATIALGVGAVVVGASQRSIAGVALVSVIPVLTLVWSNVVRGRDETEYTNSRAERANACATGAAFCGLGAVGFYVAVIRRGPYFGPTQVFVTAWTPSEGLLLAVMIAMASAFAALASTCALAAALCPRAWLDRAADVSLRLTHRALELPIALVLVVAVGWPIAVVVFWVIKRAGGAFMLLTDGVISRFARGARLLRMRIGRSCVTRR